MKNYLIITLGTREIQLLKSEISKYGFEVISEVRGVDRILTFVQPLEKPDFRIAVRSSDEFKDVFTISPRIAGKLICENFELFDGIIDWPLIRPVIDYLKSLQVKIDIVMLISTDQEEGYLNGSVKLQNYNNDTVYFGEIIERLIRKDKYFEATQIDHFGVYSNVTDMNFQYEYFSKIKDDLLYDRGIEKVYLFPQGGIDQINQSLTLRLIETFEGKVVQLQKSESLGTQELNFPGQFLDTLNKQKILKHIKDYEFGLISSDLLFEHKERENIFSLAKYAYCKLNLDYTSFPKGISGDFKEGAKDQVKLKDLYISSKILLKKGDYKNYLWRLFTLLENLYKVKCEAIIGKTSHFYNSKFISESVINTDWIKFLNELLPDCKFKNDNLLEYLKSYSVNGKKLNFNNPNRFVYKAIYTFLVVTNNIQNSQRERDLLMKIDNILSMLSNARNLIAHGLTSINISQIEKIVGKGKLLELNSLLDEFFDLKSPYGIYDDIKAEIEKLL